VKAKDSPAAETSTQTITTKTMNREGALGIQTIIIAAVGILVLSVIAYLVIGAGNETSNSISCVSKGGQCTDSGESCASGEKITSSEGQLCQNGGTCCNPLAINDG
jgi:hypothetical protein